MDSSPSASLDYDHDNSNPMPSSLPVLSSLEELEFEQDTNTNSHTGSNSIESNQSQEVPPCSLRCGDEGLPCYACSTVGTNSLYQLKELEKIMNKLKLTSNHLMENNSKSDSCLENKEENSKCSSTEVSKKEDEVASTTDIKDMKYAAFESKKIQVVGRDKSSIILRVLLTEQDGIYGQPPEYSQTSQGPLPWGPLSNIGEFSVHCPDQDNNQEMHIETTYKDYLYAAGALVLLINVCVMAVVFLRL